MKQAGNALASSAAIRDVLNVSLDEFRAVRHPFAATKRQIVKNPNPVSPLQKAFTEVASYEPGSARDQHEIAHFDPLPSI
jgi:hypothetical protein